jgi:Domain of unknown function (DUF1992)
MTERKPAGISWESWLEDRIRRARAAGAFDDLAGTGQPLPDLDQPYDPNWWVKQLIRREKLSLLPASLELLRRVESHLADIWALREEAAVRTRVKAINAEIAMVNARATDGPATRLGPLDVEAVVADWRARRSG